MPGDVQLTPIQPGTYGFLSRDRSISSWRNEKCNNAVLRDIFLAVSETFSNMWHFQNNTVPYLQIEVSVTQCQELSTFTCLFRSRYVFSLSQI